MILCILVLMLVIFIILDFIPIKMAVNIDTEDLTKLKKTEDQKVYICEHVQVTGSIWQAIGDEKGVRELLDSGVIYLAEPLKGRDPLMELNYAFQKVYEPQAHNGFVFIGKELNVETVGDIKIDGVQELTVDFNVDDWRIISPIRRDSFRDIYAPKNYLTVYDFIKFP